MPYKRQYKDIGYVPQENPLIPELTAKDNLLFWYDSKQKDLMEKLNSPLFSSLDINDILHTKISKLSGGQKKRVSIASTLLNDPKILILDEPSSSLDLICRDNIKQFMETYLNDGGTIIMTTHEEAELSLCNKLYVINDGILFEIDKDMRGQQLINTINGGNYE